MMVSIATSSSTDISADGRVHRYGGVSMLMPVSSAALDCGECCTRPSTSSEGSPDTTEYPFGGIPTTSDFGDSRELTQSQSPPLPQRPHPCAEVFGRLFAPQDFDILESLGEGFFSMVHKVRIRSSGEVLVLKVGKGDGNRQAEHASIARETAMLRKLVHPHVLALKGLCVERSKVGWDVHLLVDYCSGGSLAKRVVYGRAMSWPEKASYARDIAAAMQHIHGLRVMHRDLTSMNVLLQRCHPSEAVWDRAVVADFGLSCEFPQPFEILPQVGTTYFMSPECLNEEFYDEKSDVFSFGIILCQIIAQIDSDPDSGMHRTDQFGLDYRRFASYCPVDTPEELLQLAFTCCLMNPVNRPSFSSIHSRLRSMPITRPPSPQSLSTLHARGSVWDSPVRLAHRARLSLRKPGQRGCAFGMIQTVTEGEALPFEHPETAAEKLARGMAEAEHATHTHLNPFNEHQRFRHARKIVPQRDGIRRRSETKGTEVVNPPSRPLRRWSSLPTGMRQPGIGVEETVPDGPGRMPIAFMECDMNFVRETKQMRRFPSRRHTLAPSVASRASRGVSTLPPGHKAPETISAASSVSTCSSSICDSENSAPSLTSDSVADAVNNNPSKEVEMECGEKDSNSTPARRRGCSVSSSMHNHKCTIL